jgi:hypothetical protein
MKSHQQKISTLASGFSVKIFGYMQMRGMATVAAVFVSAFVLSSQAQAAALELEITRVSDTQGIVSVVGGDIGSVAPKTQGWLFALHAPYATAPAVNTHGAISTSTTMSVGTEEVNNAWFHNFPAGTGGPKIYFDRNNTYPGSAPLHSPITGAFEFDLSTSSTLAPVGSSGVVSWGISLYANPVTIGSWTMVANSNEAPTADAGANQSIHAGQNVTLNGEGSSDDNTATQDLAFIWSFSSQPIGSTSTLIGAGIEVSFLADLPGEYTVDLIVTDEGSLSSDSATVTISSANVPPTADAGVDQGSFVGDTIMLDGSASSDADLDAIASYVWGFTSQPVGSVTSMSGANSALPTFIGDVPGIYVAQLMVNDGYADSTPDEVNIAVVTVDAYAEALTVESITLTAGLPPTSVTTTGNQQAMGNTLSSVIDQVQKGNVSQAIKKLEDAIAHTDGCKLRGSPDVNGKGPTKDTVNNCTDQAAIYPVLIDALDALKL